LWQLSEGTSGKPILQYLKDKYMAKLSIVEHPLIQHKLGLIRNKETGTKEFRENLSEIAGLMAYEITRDLPLKECLVKTPLGSGQSKELTS